MSKQQSIAHPVLTVNGLSKAFTRPVLKNINLSVDGGQSVLLCGINGAGKSTLLRIMAGLLAPDSGSVTVAGKCLHRESEKVKARLGVIMHQSLLYADLTVEENLDFVAALYNVPQKRQRIASLLEQVGLTAFRYDRAAVLSRGLLQRLSIARALIHQPEIILADEPFTGLDSASVDYLVAMLNSFRQGGGTVILTTHDTALGFRCADRVIVIDKTQIILDRGAAQIEQTQFTQDYLRYARELA